MRLPVSFAALVALALGGCDGAGLEALPQAREGRTADRVVRVIDGDTVHLARTGRARLIGIDTPEVYGGFECFGREASAYAKRVLRAGRPVEVKLGVEPRDRYDRALVDLWLADGRHFNAMLVRQGYATPYTVPPNVEHAERYVRLAREARRAGRGLWRACPG